MQNGGTPYIIDMSPADAQFQYYTNTGGAARIFDGSIGDDGSGSNQVYLSDLNESTVWTLDLRDEGTVTSVKVYGLGGEDYGSTADGDNWVCSLLDSGKSAIANKVPSPLRRLSEFKMIIEHNKCPRFRKIKE